MSFAWIVSKSCFLTNVFYGSKIASVFELAHGYTPSISEIGSSHIPAEIMDAHKELQAKRLLNKSYKARGGNANVSHYHIGDIVLGHIPGGARESGQWGEFTVTAVSADGNCIQVGEE